MVGDGEMGILALSQSSTLPQFHYLPVLPSRMVRNWLAGTFCSRSRIPLGHSTSTESTVWADPSPKCALGSLLDK
jgi:hypothetical protein